MRYHIGEMVRINAGWFYGRTARVLRHDGEFLVLDIDGGIHCSPYEVLPLTANNGD